LTCAPNYEKGPAERQPTSVYEADVLPSRAGFLGL